MRLVQDIITCEGAVLFDCPTLMDYDRQFPTSHWIKTKPAAYTSSSESYRHRTENTDYLTQVLYSIFEITVVCENHPGINVRIIHRTQQRSDHISPSDGRFIMFTIEHICIRFLLIYE